jgi:16S rRNA processing protein RimM
MPTGEAPPRDSPLIAIGRVVTTHGLQGELRIRLFNPDSTAIRPGTELILQHERRETRHRVHSVRPHKRVILVVLEGCDSIEQAEVHVGADACIARSELPVLGPDEVYHFELIGMTVVTTSGEELGTVAEVMAAGSSDVCVVRNRAREHLIPMVADVIQQIDRVGQRLVIEPVPGLLDEA